jgi:putative inorganic carbon (HCO3(-)) transporter
MGIIKKINRENIFFYLFLVLFPFGQIIRFGIVHPIDLVVGSAAIIALISKGEKPQVFKYFSIFLFVATFSWVFSVFYFWRAEVFFGALYLLRLWAYSFFFLYIYNMLQTQKNLRVFIFDSIVAVTSVSALFGWLQYLVYPNFRAFTIWGWDDHYLRISGTFLDPGYLGIILVFGAIVLIDRIIQKFELKSFIMAIFLIVTILFTYSRASYLALIAGVFLLCVRKKELLLRFGVFFASFLFFIFILPTSQNNILKFTRVFSAINRVENYKETVEIFKLSPVFGIGYNNLCLAKEKTTGFINYDSHSCSGSDSSILYILATTGIAGLFSFLYLIAGTAPFIAKENKIVMGGIVASLFIHSMFANSVFYPWVITYVLILFAGSMTQKSLRN